MHCQVKQSHNKKKSNSLCKMPTSARLFRSVGLGYTEDISHGGQGCLKVQLRRLGQERLVRENKIVANSSFYHDL